MKQITAAWLRWHGQTAPVLKFRRSSPTEKSEKDFSLFQFSGSQVRRRVLNLKDIKCLCSSFGSHVDLYESKQQNSQRRQGKGCGGFGTFYKTEKLSKLNTVFMYSAIFGKE